MGLTALWHIKDEEYDKVSDAISQLSSDSDRAVGLVAASIVENALTNAIKDRLHSHKLVIKEMFRSAGAIGTFDAKINLALLIGILTNEGHRDILTMKNIRNAFAHDLAMKSFNVEKLKALCANLKIVDEYVVELPPGTQHPIKIFIDTKKFPGVFGDSKPKKIRTERLKPPFLAFEGATEKLRQPRERYLYSAMIFSVLLGTLPDCPPPTPVV